MDLSSEYSHLPEPDTSHVKPKLRSFTMSFVDSTLELNYWKYHYQNVSNIRILFSMVVFSFVYAFINLFVLQMQEFEEWDIQSQFFGIDLSLILGIFFLFQAFFLVPVAYHLQNDMRSPMITLYQINKFQILYHIMIILLDIVFIYIVCHQTEAQPGLDTAYIHKPLDGSSYIYICV